MKKYVAALIPRFLRQSRLGYLQLRSIIGSQITQNKNNSLAFDLVMLPAQEFQRMRTNVGFQPLMAPQPTPGDSSFKPGFVINDAKQVVVPDGVTDPEAYAKSYFLKLFGIDPPAEQKQLSSFAQAAKECATKI